MKKNDILDEMQIKELAVPLSKIVMSFFNDERNEEAYQRWIEKRKGKSKEGFC